MLKLVKEDYSAPEDGEYIAEVNNIDEFSSEKHPDYGTSIRFLFKILEEPFVGSLVSGLVTSVWRPGNKLDKWLQGMGVDGTAVGDELKLEDLKGKQIRVYVEKDIKSGYTNVKNVKPLRSTDKLAPAVQVNQTVTAAQPAAAPVHIPANTIPQVVVKPTVPVAPTPRKQIPF